MAEREVSKTMAKRLRRHRRKPDVDDAHIALMRRRIRMGDTFDRADAVAREKK
jgi:hypothetical protein